MTPLTIGEFAAKASTPGRASKRAGRVLLAAFPALVVSCSSAERDAGPSIRDSAGVRIVENAGPTWAGDDAWIVSGQPVLSIGAVDGPPTSIFSRVRGATRLDDGRIAVADGGSSSIRFYASDGSFLSSSGRQGQGPGEYIDIAWLERLPGDTLVVIDGIAQRISILDPRGEHVRSTSFTTTEAPRLYNAAGILDDGRILAFAGIGGVMRVENAGKLIEDTLRFDWFERTGERGGTLATLVGAPRWGLRTARTISFPYVPFAAGPVAAAGGDRFVISSGTEAELRVFDASGRPELVIRWPASRRASSAEISRLRDVLLGSERTPAQRSANRQLLAEAPVPDSLPVASAVLVDADGYIWVERYRTPWESQPVWDVFEPDGRWLGQVSTPERFRIHEIGADYLLGTWRDDLNVEFVRMYGLERETAELSLRRVESGS